MNNWNCQKCNFINNAADRFCLNCGEEVNFEPQSASDLPPTVVGFQPQIVPNQQNFTPNQPQFAPNQLPPQFQPQVPQPQQQYQQQQFPSPASQPQVLPPRKSKKFVIIGGIIGLLVFAVGGFALWRNVIEPRMREAQRKQREIDHQNRANSMTAMNLMGTEFADGNRLVYQRNETLDKLQILQATQNLPPELKQKISEVNDAAAAAYITNTDNNQKAFLQIFKFNTPGQARAVCQQMITEIDKKREQFKSVTLYPQFIRDSHCVGRVEGKNGEGIRFTSLYGFLYITSGKEKESISMGLHEAVTKQLDPY